jgi:hypothetical protein
MFISCQYDLILRCFIKPRRIDTNVQVHIGDFVVAALGHQRDGRGRFDLFRLVAVFLESTGQSHAETGGVSGSDQLFGVDTRGSIWIKAHHTGIGLFVEHLAFGADDALAVF